MNRPLTPKQSRFVNEYLVDFNATQAAIRAGYSPRTAAAQASRLFTNVKVYKAIAQAVEERAKRTAIDQDWVLDRLQEVVDRCMQAIPVCDRQGQPSGEWRFNAGGANRALEIIGKHLRMFADKVEVEQSRSVRDLSTAELMAIVVEEHNNKPTASSEALLAAYERGKTLSQR